MKKLQFSFLVIGLILLCVGWPLSAQDTLPEITETPTDIPTSVPTETPLPSDTPTEIPTLTPTDLPTETPTDIPTSTPTEIPILTPTETSIPLSSETPAPTLTETPTLTPGSSATGLTATPVILRASDTCTYYVNAGDRAGLIAAIASSNGDTLADTICLSNSTYTFSSINNTTTNGSNTLPLITGDLTILGDNSTINMSGTLTFRFFEVGTFGKLNLSDLTFSNNQNYAIDNGGQLTVTNVSFTAAKLKNRGTATLTNITVSANTGNYTVRNTGTLTVSNSRFIGNTRGAISTQGTLNLNNSLFQDNFASDGGAIEALGGTATITSTTFDHNSATTEGGAIIHKAGTTTITNTIFTRNFNTDAQYGGGGAIMAHPSGTLNLSNSCIVGNSAARGMVIQRGNSTLNAANNWWGLATGPSIVEGASIDTVTSNTYTPFLTVPPAFCPVQPLTAVDQRITTPKNTAVAVTLSTWGGRPPYTMTNISTPAHGVLTGTAPNLTYTPNTDYEGIDSFTFDTVDADNTVLTATVTFYMNVTPPPNIFVNTTTQEVPFVNNGNCTLGEAVQAASSNKLVDGCAAGSMFAFDIIDVPAGIYTLSAPHNTGANGANGLPIITGTTIVNGNGATITRSASQFRFFEVSVEGNLTLNNLTLSNGSATGNNNGGAVYSVSSPITINNGTFINNVAVNGSGGAIRGNTITLTNTTFTSNSSKGNGGAIAGSTITITGSIFTDNTVTAQYGEGGAVSGGVMTISNSTFTHNTGYTGGALRVVSFTGTSTITDSTFDNNSGSISGGAIHLQGHSLTITNSIFTRNKTAFFTEEYPPQNGGGNITVTNSCFVGNTGTTVADVRWRAVGNFTNNWWGAADGATGQGGSGDAFPPYAQVTYSPFLTTPPFPNCPVLPPVTVAQTLSVPYRTPTAINLSGKGGLPPYTFGNFSTPAHGILSNILPTSVTYTPNAGFVGSDSFTYLVTDSAGGTITNTVNLSVYSTLQAFTQLLYTLPDTPVSLTLLAFGGTKPYTFNITSQPSQGTLTGTPPNLIYTPPTGVTTGTTLFNFSVTDADGFVNSGSVSISIVSVLEVSNQDYYVTPGQRITADLMRKGGHSPFVYTIDSAPEHGTFVDKGSGVFWYTMNADYSGLDTAVVHITDGSNQSATATFRFSAGEPLQVIALTLQTPYLTAVNMTLSASGGVTPYTYTVGAPQHGMVSGTAPNVTYTPDSGFSGVDKFTVTVTDALGFKRQADMKITVLPPVSLNNQTLFTNYETPLTITAQASGGVQSYTYTLSNPAHGTLTGEVPTLIYTPNIGFSGTDTFTISVRDSLQVVANGIITVNVSTPVNVTNVSGLIAALSAANASPAPDTIVLSAGTYTLTAVNNTTDTTNGLPAIDTEIVIRGNNAIIERNTSSPQFRFFHVRTAGKLTLLDLTLRNGNVGSQNAGAIMNQGVVTLRNTTISGNRAYIAGGIFNDAGAQLTVIDSRILNNIASYRSGGIHNGNLSLTGVNPVATIQNSVISGNQAAEKGGGLYNVGVMTITDTVLVNNTAAQGGALYIDTNRHQTQVTGSCIVGNTGIDVYFSYTSGAQSLTVQNSWWGRVIGPVVGTSINNYVSTQSNLTQGILGCPTAPDISLLTRYQQPVPVPLNTTGGTAPYNYSLFTQPQHGTVSGNATNLSYTPANGYSGQDTFTFKVVDAAGMPAFGAVSINIAPQLLAPDQTFEAPPATALPFTLNVSGGTPPYTYSNFSTPLNGVLAEDAPELTYTSNAGFNGIDSFTYSVTDSLGETITGRINVVVRALTASNQTLNTPYNVPLTITLTSTGGASPRTYGITQPPANGRLTGATPSLTYIPNNGFSGEDSFSFDVNDITGSNSTGVVTITVGAKPAATIQVNTTAQESPFVNNGACTLGEAIQAANTNQQIDTCAAGSPTATDIIDIPAGTYSMTVAISNWGDFAFPLIYGDVTLRGAGIGQTIIQRSSGYMGIFQVWTDSHVSFEGMTLRNGYTQSTDLKFGGAILNRGVLNVTHVSFEDNYGANGGGAIYNHTGAIATIIASGFRNNYSAFWGGAIYNRGTLTLLSSGFKDNGNWWDEPTNGTMLYNTGTFTAHENCFSDPIAGDYAIRNADSLPAMDARYNWWGSTGTNVNALNVVTAPILTTQPASCNLVEIPPLTVPAGDSEALISAVAYANTVDGAVIELAPGSTYTLSRTFSGTFENEALLLPEISGNITIIGNGATITKDPNQTARFFNVYFGKLTLNDLTLSNSKTNEEGAINVFRGELRIDGVHFINNVIADGSFEDGGAISIYGHIPNGAVLTVTNSTFEGNHSPTGGGAISAFETAVNITTSIFRSNSAVAGSAIDIRRGTNITISDNCFLANEGAAVYNDPSNNGGSIISAANNWWGAINGPSGAGSGSGDAVGANINYAPFKTAPPANCPPLPLVANDQALTMNYFEPSMPIDLTAQGGIAPYTFTTGNPTHGTLSGTAPDLIYTPDTDYIGADSFTFTAIDALGTADTATVTLAIDGNKITVTSTSQEVPFVTNGNCTLGEAIQAANTDAAVDTCAAGNGADVIDLAGETYTLTHVDNIMSGANGLPIITSEIAITGGATVKRDLGAPQFRIFHVAAGGKLMMHDLTISGGRLLNTNYDTDRGAGIYNLGSLTLSGTTLTDNQVSYMGGGLYSAGANASVDIRDSALTNNRAGTGGAADLCAPTKITNSTITGNNAEYGAGLYTACLPVIITDSTIANNAAARDGGGMLVHTGVVTIMRVKMLDNRGSRGGSLYNESSDSAARAVNIANSCIMGGSVQDTLWYGKVSAAYNWWGSTAGPSGVGPGRGSQVIGQSVIYTPFLTAPILGCGIYPPGGIHQDLVTAWNKPINIPALTAIDGTPSYTFTITTPPEHGSLSGTAPDSLIYTPEADFSGSDTFSFTVTDSNNESGTGSVNITVAEALYATADPYVTAHKTPVDIYLNASGGHTPYVFTVNSSPQHGSLTGAAPNLTYSPDEGFIGDDSFRFTVQDDLGSTSSATITITVTDALTANDQSLNTSENTAVLLKLSASGGTPPYTFGNLSTPAHGALLRQHLSEWITYVPRTGFVGIDTFTFDVTDSNQATITGIITVTISTAAINIASGDSAALAEAINDANQSAETTVINLSPRSSYASVALAPISGNVVINGNGATLEGNGLFPALRVTGTLTIDKLMIVGGVSNEGGTLLITNSTLADPDSRAILNSGNLTLVNTTISGNDAGIEMLDGTANVMSSTIANNKQTGINVTSGTVTLSNTILTGNVNTNCLGEIESDGHNIDSGTTCELDGVGDQSNVNPRIGALSDNGGPTWTHALLANSPAIDSANNSTCMSGDQRGAQRPIDSNNDGVATCDVGAFEISAISPAADLSLSQTNPSDPALFGYLSVYTMTVTNNGPGLATGVQLVDILPGGTTFVSASVSQGAGCEQSEANITCNLGTLGSGKNIIVILTVRVAFNAPASLTNHAQVTTADRDPTAGNNVSEMTINTMSPGAPTRPVILWPTSNAATNDVTPMLIWNVSTYALSYDVQVDDNSNFRSPLVNVTNVTGSTLTLDAPLARDGMYYVRVRAVNSLNVRSAWSRTATLRLDRTAPSAPRLSAPQANSIVADTTPTFAWAAVSGANFYRLEVAQNVNFDQPLIAIGLTMSRHTPNNPLDYGIYYFRVRARDAADNWGNWSAVRQITITNLSSPRDGIFITDRTPTFRWKTVANATGYRLVVDNNNDFQSPEYEFTTQNPRLASRTLPQALPYGKYYWRVEIQMANQSIVPDVYWGLTVTPPLPGVPRLTAPAGNALLNNPIVTLTWTAVSYQDGGITYTLEVDDNSNFSSPVLGAHGLLTNMYTALNTLPNGRYYWRVRAENSYGAAGRWSTARSFRIMSP